MRVSAAVLLVLAIVGAVGSRAPLVCRTTEPHLPKLDPHLLEGDWYIQQTWGIGSTNMTCGVMVRAGCKALVWTWRMRARLLRYHVRLTHALQRFGNWSMAGGSACACFVRRVKHSVYNKCISILLSVTFQTNYTNAGGSFHMQGVKLSRDPTDLTKFSAYIKVFGLWSPLSAPSWIVAFGTSSDGGRLSWIAEVEGGAPSQEHDGGCVPPGILATISIASRRVYLSMARLAQAQEALFKLGYTSTLVPVRWQSNPRGVTCL